MARDKRSNGCSAAVAAGRQEGRRSTMADCATQEDQCHPRKIFVGGLAHKTTTQNLRDYFARFGAIIDAVVLRWPDGRSRGFGYVTFAEVAAASKALKETHQIAGRGVDVKRAVPGTNKLFVGGLPQSATAVELRDHFEKYGVVSDAVVMIDPATNRSRGFGFVCFLPGQDGAAAVLAALEQYEHHRIRNKWIEVKSAAPPHKLAGKDGPDSSPSSRSCGEASSSDPGASPVAAPPGLQPRQPAPAASEPRKIQCATKVATLSELIPSPKAASGLPHMPPGLVNPGAGWLPAAAPQGWKGPAAAAAAAAGLPHFPWPTPMAPAPDAGLLLPWACVPPPAPLGPAPDLLRALSGSTAASSEGTVEEGQPAKVQLGADPGGPQAEGLGSKAEAGGIFDASKDLQRSLEEFIRLRSKQAIVAKDGKEEAGESPTKTKPPVMLGGA